VQRDSLPLAAFATASATPSDASPGLVEWIEPIRFSAFAIWHPEPAAEVPRDAVAAWLLEPLLLARAIRLRDAVLHNYGAGGAPMDPARLLQAARRIVGHPQTALLLCLTVARTFARGGEAVHWRAIDRRRGAFTDGVQTHVPDNAGAPSLFYLLFSPAAFGTADTGDWYRFFAIAALAAFTAGAGCTPPRPLPEGPALRLACRVDAAQAALRQAGQRETPAYRAWLWANALSFVEWGIWGDSQARAHEAAHIAIAAARLGLELAGGRIDPAWRWAVPAASRLRDGAAPGACVAESLTGADGGVA
jgi:hypothetical protein